MRVNQRLYAAVGRTCHEWALLEDELRAVVICLSGSGTVQALAAGESGRNLIRTCRRLLPYSRTLTDEQEPALLELLAACETLGDARNMVAHSSWMRLSAKPDEYYLQMSKYAPEVRTTSDPNKRRTGFFRGGRAEQSEVEAVAAAINTTREQLRVFRFDTFESQPVAVLFPRGWRLMPDSPRDRTEE